MPRANSGESSPPAPPPGTRSGPGSGQLAPVALGPPDRGALQRDPGQLGRGPVVTGQQGRLADDPGRADRLDRVGPGGGAPGPLQQGPAAGSPLRASSRPSADSPKLARTPGSSPASRRRSPALGLVPAARRQQHAAVRLQVVLVGGEAVLAGVGRPRPAAGRARGSGPGGTAPRPGWCRPAGCTRSGPRTGRPRPSAAGGHYPPGSPSRAGPRQVVEQVGDDVPLAGALAQLQGLAGLGDGLVEAVGGFMMAAR